MEKWQEEIIRRNLSFIITNVKCTITLLSKLEERNVLSAEDVDTVNVTLKQTDKSYKLIRLLTQKLHGFEIFIAVLLDPDVKQYAPAKLLIEERSNYYKEHRIAAPNPVLAFPDFPDVSAITTPHENTQTHSESYHEVPSELPKELHDFVHEGVQLDVDVKWPEATVTSKPSRYILPPKGKGYAFILNIVEIPGEKIRKGADLDTTYMTNLWKGLGYEIFPKNEDFRKGHSKCEGDIRKELEIFREKCIEDKIDSFVIFIGSHGYNDVILTSDKKTLDIYDDIIYQFQFGISERKNGKMVEKRVARIFLNQSCQIDAPQDLVKSTNSGGSRTPNVSDTIYIKAQIPKFEAGRDIKCGSYFVIVLTYVLMTKAWNTQLLAMLEEVQALLKRVSKYAGDDACQICPFVQMGFSHPLYFFTREKEV
ncbi:unnamed protein product [Orchesella dallaii]|uniref:Uncharacterized protein n=1 Tax=Orchesella dallaii TaxID=48710 RepID=A0ABP1RJ05_9HEXA